MSAYTTTRLSRQEAIEKATIAFALTLPAVQDMRATLESMSDGDIEDMLDDNEEESGSSFVNYQIT